MVITVDDKESSVSIEFDKEEQSLLDWYTQNNGGPVADMLKSTLSTFLRQISDQQIRQLRGRLDTLLKKATVAQLQKIVESFGVSGVLHG